MISFIINVVSLLACEFERNAHVRNSRRHRDCFWAENVERQ